MTYTPIRIDYRTRLGRSIKAAQMLTKAMHSPYFSRTFWCWSRMRRSSGTPLFEFIDDTGYCLDRTQENEHEGSENSNCQGHHVAPGTG